MKQLLDKQKVQGTNALGGSGTSRLESLSREGNVVYVDFANKQIIELQKLNKTIGEGLGDKGELSKQLKKLKTTLDSGSKPGAITQKVMGMAQTGKPGDIAPPTGIKDFFTARGFLDKTGILKRGHSDTAIGRGIDKMLGNREQKGLQADAEKKDYAERKQQYVKDRIATKGSTFGDEKSFGKTFDKSEKIQKEILKNEEEVKGLKDRGFKEGQIKRGGFYAKNQTLEKELAKTDVRFSESFGGVNEADPKKPKVAKSVNDDDPNSTVIKAKDIKKVKAEKIADEDSNSTVKKVKAEKIADEDSNSTVIKAKDIKKVKAEKIADAELPANVLKFPGKTKESSGLGAADMTEAEVEQQKIDDTQTKILQEIADNTSSLKKPIGNKPETPKEGMGIGIIGTILAGIVGSIVGLARAWVKTIKLFADALIPTELMEKIKKGFSAVEEFFSGIFSKFKSLFDFSGESKIGKVFATIKEAMSSFIKPFVTAYEVIADLLKGPVKMVEGVFTLIKEYFSAFAKTVGKVAGIVGKLMFPVLIIMTVWDTVKGIIEGFKEEGIIGGIKGAITGFFNSLIFGPLDMLKDAIAWVLGFFGFDKAKEMLESFSLEDIFKKFINAVFAPIDLIKKLFSDIMGWFENLEIPGFEIDIGILKKKFGPWYPFKKEEKAPESGVDTKVGSVTPKDNAPKTVANQDMSKSSISPKEAQNILENGSKRDIESFGGVEKLKQIASGGASAKLAPYEPQVGNQVAAQSADSEMAKTVQPSQSSTVIAPTSNVNNSSSTTYAMKPRVRNPDEGVRRQLAQRYGT